MRFILLGVLIFLYANLFGISKEDSLVNLIYNKLDSMPKGFSISITLIKNENITNIGLIKENNGFVMHNLSDSLFEIGSITKVFTFTVLANEIVNRKIKLNKPINNVFNYKLNKNIKVTYKSLANHTSGAYRIPYNLLPFLMKNKDNPYAQYSYRLFDEYLQKQFVIKDVKADKYAYSNLGAGILAYALSKSNNMEFETLLKKTIFNKYKMINSGYNKQTSYAGIDSDGKPSKNWDFNALKGAGGLISTTSDLSKFIIAQFNSADKILKLTQKETYSVSDKLSIGLGWHIINPNNSDKKYWHNGGTGGFTSSISFRPNNKTGVIILSNISAMHKKSSIIDELCFELLDYLNSKTYAKNLK